MSIIIITKDFFENLSEIKAFLLMSLNTKNHPISQLQTIRVQIISYFY